MSMQLYREYEISSLNMNLIAQDMHNLCQKYSIKIILLTGDMGTGKTTLIRHFVSLYNPSLIVVSPTFAYSNYYNLDDNTELMHIDLYRVNDPESILQLNIDEFLTRNQNIVAIEWPEKIQYSLNKHEYCILNISFSYIENNIDHRKIILSIE